MNKITEQLKDHRKLPLDEVNAKLRDAKLKYQDLAGQLAMGKIKNAAGLKAAKKEVARLSTVYREKEILMEVNNG